MRKAILAACVAVLAACGGSSDGIDPTKVTFDYPAGAPPNPTEQQAVAGARLTLEGVQPLLDHDLTDPAVADPGGGSVVTLGEELMDSASTGQAKPAPLRSATERAARRAVTFALGQASPAYDPSCVTSSPSVIRFSGCTETEHDPDLGATVTVVVDGTFTRGAAAGAAQIGWALTLRTNGVADSPYGPMTLRATARFTGELTLGPSTLTGASRSDLTVTVSIPGESESEAVTHLTDYDLTYAAAPFCVTAGTLEVRRVFTRRPAGAGGDPSFRDAGLRLAFGPACDAALVAWSVR